MAWISFSVIYNDLFSLQDIISLTTSTTTKEELSSSLSSFSSSSSLSSSLENVSQIVAHDGKVKSKKDCVSRKKKSLSKDLADDIKGKLSLLLKGHT